jgi:hypothetical protein
MDLFPLSLLQQRAKDPGLFAEGRGVKYNSDLFVCDACVHPCTLIVTDPGDPEPKYCPYSGEQLDNTDKGWHDPRRSPKYPGVA